MPTKIPVCPAPAAAPAMADPMATVSRVSTVILYHTDTGNIAHVHQETTLAGGVPSTQAQLAATAQRLLAKMQPSASANVAALVLNGSAKAMMCPGATYKVIDCALVQG